MNRISVQGSKGEEPETSTKTLKTAIGDLAKKIKSGDIVDIELELQNYTFALFERFKEIS